MALQSDPLILLMRQGQGICYRRYPIGPRFWCDLQPDMLRHLHSDPAFERASPKQPKAFWLRVLVDSIVTGGQIVFESLVPPRGGGAGREVAIRSLFQLGGDVVVSIDERILTRADGRDLLEAHTWWTGWCLTQLGQGLALPPIAHHVGWSCLTLGPLCFIGGIFQYGGMLQPLGILLSMPAHLLLSPGQRRHLGWLPLVVLGAMVGIMPLVVAGGPEVGIWQFSMLALLQGGLWRPLGGRCVPWLARKALSSLTRWNVRHTVAQASAAPERRTHFS